MRDRQHSESHTAQPGEELVLPETFSIPSSPAHTVPTQYWHRLEDGRVQCDLCPRFCRLREGQRGLCFVRASDGEGVVLTTYGRSSGFCIDPVEKKPLNHFLPGTPVLSFGTAGCNLACKFCQNWDISKSREIDTLADSASPHVLARAAEGLGCASVAFTYNDPVIFLEYAVDVAAACRERGVRAVAVTAGEICPEPRREFFAAMDAANVDLKAFSEDFYRNICGGKLSTVLDTLLYLRHETDVWLEITTLLIPGANDSDEEIEALGRWVAEELGPEVPLHFTAFHPDWKMRDRPATPPATVQRARRIARDQGLHHVYTGNIHDEAGQTTFCPRCGETVIGRDGYRLTGWNLILAEPEGRGAGKGGGACSRCGQAIPGRFASRPGAWGSRRLPVRLADWAGPLPAV